VYYCSFQQKACDKIVSFPTCFDTTRTTEDGIVWNTVEELEKDHTVRDAPIASLTQLDTLLPPVVVRFG